MLLLWYGRKYYGRTFPSLVFQVRGDSFRTSLSTARWTRGYRWTWIPGMSNTQSLFSSWPLLWVTSVRGELSVLLRQRIIHPLQLLGKSSIFIENVLSEPDVLASRVFAHLVLGVSLHKPWRKMKDMRKIRPWKRRISFATHLAKRCRCNGRSCSELTLRTLDSLQETFCQQRVYLFV